MALSQLTWPLGLPQRPQVDGFQHQTGRDVIVSEFDVGFKRQRKRSSAAMTQITATYVLKDETKKNSFLDFCQLSEGRSFWWPYPDADLTYRYARMAEAPVLTPFGAHAWSVTLKLELWPWVEREG